MTRAVSATERERIVAMLVADASPAEIVAATGRSIYTVARVARVHGLTADRKCQCGSRIGPRNTSGICTVCHSRSPEGRARRSATMTELSAKFWADPEARQRMTQASRDRVGRTVQSPAAILASKSPETRAKAVASKRAADMAWCPRSMWDTYRYLTQSQNVPAAEARRMVLEMHEAEGRREVRRIAAEMQQRHARQKAQAL